MSLISFNYFVFLLCTFFLYYLIRPLQKYTLLGASLIFYLMISGAFGRQKLLVLICILWGISYFAALLIQKSGGKIKRGVFFLSLLSISAILFLFKYSFNAISMLQSVFRVEYDFSFLDFATIIGISYYALSAIGYLIDVYWGTVEASKNVVDVGLFIFFFPQLISGPITRFGDMNQQFNKNHSLQYDTVTMGMRRMLWGYFQKLIISERFAMVVSAVYGNIDSYSGIGILLANLCYAIQLFADFSGCMDIIMGSAMLFGIQLPENFNAPFFSESIQEFWQRWHISLGTWFKDYVMYPIQKSGPLQKCGKLAKKILGKKRGKKIPFYLSMMVLWFFIGIWHGGTSFYFMSSAILPCFLMISADIFQPVFSWMVSKLGINTQCESWHWFRRFRTQCLLCLSWIFINAQSSGRGFEILFQIIRRPYNYTSFNTAISNMGISALDILLMTLCLVVLLRIEKMKYDGASVFERMNQQNFWVRVLVVYGEILLILFCGKVGSSSFIYFQF